MKRKIGMGIFVLLVATLAGCGTASQKSSTDTGHRAGTARPTGTERDAHGCIPSAGYRWCAKTQQCERPWELAQSHSFARTLEAFDTFCGNASTDEMSEK